MDSPDPPEQLVTPREAHAVQPIVPELDDLAIKEIENSRAEAMHKQERGLVGVLCGTRREKFGNVAFLVIVACFILIGAALNSSGLTDRFFKFLSALLGVVGLTLSYLFRAHDKQ